MSSSTCATWNHLCAIYAAASTVATHARHLRTFGDCPDALVWLFPNDTIYHQLLQRYHQRMRHIMVTIATHNTTTLQSIWLEYIWKCSDLLALLLSSCHHITRWNPMVYGGTRSDTDAIAMRALHTSSFRHQLQSLSLHCHRPPLSLSCHTQHTHHTDNDHGNGNGMRNDGVYGMVSISTVMAYLSDSVITSRLQHLQLDMLPNVHVQPSSSSSSLSSPASSNGISLLATCSQLIKLDIGIHCDSLLWSCHDGIAHQLGDLVWPAMVSVGIVIVIYVHRWRHFHRWPVSISLVIDHSLVIGLYIV